MSSSEDHPTPRDKSGAVPRATPARAPVADDVQAHIGMQLRSVYENMIAEPVPDRFLKLLEDLDRRTSGGS